MSPAARAAGRLCACGMPIVGRGYVDATDPPTVDGPVLCRGCAFDHGRERPGDVVAAPPTRPPGGAGGHSHRGVPVVDFDDCAREVAAALRTSIDPAGEVYAAVARTAAWLDAHNGIGGPELGLRVAKVAEEGGEAIGAWIGLVGQNPRKGVTHTGADVAGELADVVLAALVAIHSLGYDPARVLGVRARTVVDRVAETEAAQ